MDVEPPAAGGHGVYNGLVSAPNIASRYASFVIFRQKITILTPFGSHFSRFYSHLKVPNYC